MKPKIILLWGSEWLCYTKDGATGYGKTPTSAYRGWCIASAHRRRGRRGAMPAPSGRFRIAKDMVIMYGAMAAVVALMVVTSMLK